MRFKIAFGVFSGGFLGFQNMCFCRFGPFKGGLGKPFWHSCGAWGRTWALGKDLWALLALFCDLWGAFLASLGALMFDIGCLWAPCLLVGPLWETLGSFADHFGHFVETIWTSESTFCLHQLNLGKPRNSSEIRGSGALWGSLDRELFRHIFAQKSTQ